MKKLMATLFWVLLAVLGGWAYSRIAIDRGEHLNSVYILIAALCTYAIGYRFYSKWITVKVLMLDERRATPCEVHDDGKDFVKTNKWIVFGHHFAAISGPGPLVGPVLAAQFGYLPGTLWILLGVVLGGAVQDFIILFASLRRDGKSLGQMVRDELNTTAGFFALAAILAIIIILLAVLALVVVKALAESSWGVFTVAATIPIAMFMGGYLRFFRVGKVLEASVIGVVLLLLAVWGGKLVYESPTWSHALALKDIHLAWAIIIYGLAASILPVWLLLAPRDYLSTFMKLGTIFALAIGIFLLLPDLQMPAITRFIDGSGPVVAGKVFPFCFITIACGAISGFHTLIASGTTPKLITRETYARPIGYGAMCLESMVAIMALIAACTLEPGVYLSMNMKGDPAVVAAKATELGFPVTVPEMDSLAEEVGEKSLFGRTGGAATLAVGMAHIFSKVVSGHGLDLWYHFAIMFEALFILTTIDAGTRVGRYILQDVLGHLWKPLGDIRKVSANVVASLLMVVGWGYFLIQGVRDPLGGVNSLWPLFGVANQMLAAIALCLATTVLLKMNLGAPTATRPDGSLTPSRNKPAVALITFLPLVWLLTVTMTAGTQKIFNQDPRIGFLAQARVLDNQAPELRQTYQSAVRSGDAASIETASKALKTNRSLRFNNLLDAAVAGIFLTFVSVIVALSIVEWTRLLRGTRPPVLHETPAQWLPDYAVAESRPWRFGTLSALALALAREVSGQNHVDRAQVQAATAPCCACHQESAGATQPLSLSRAEAGRVYARTLEEKFTKPNRCC